MKRIPLVVIVGPTAVGKSLVAVELAARMNGEIISADSMQVYREMNIGTAKLSPSEMIATNGIRVPHHLLDIINPEEDFSVADYQKLAEKKIIEIHKTGKIPFLVGGTGLYINAVIDKYQFEKVPVKKELRAKLWKEAKEKGNFYILNKLKEIDPKTAEKLHENDLKRIIRALEYYYQTGKLLSQKNSKQKNNIYKPAMIGLYCKRQLLYKKIDERVDEMINRGLINEVNTLLERGVSPNSTSMQALGYKQIAQYLKGEIRLDEAITRIKRDTRHFAKRQLTWFRRDKRIYWFEVTESTNMKNLVEKIKELACRIIHKEC